MGSGISFGGQRGAIISEFDILLDKAELDEHNRQEFRERFLDLVDEIESMRNCPHAKVVFDINHQLTLGGIFGEGELPAANIENISAECADCGATLPAYICMETQTNG